VPEHADELVGVPQVDDPSLASELGDELRVELRPTTDRAIDPLLPVERADALADVGTGRRGDFGHARRG